MSGSDDGFSASGPCKMKDCYLVGQAKVMDSYMVGQVKAMISHPGRPAKTITDTYLNDFQRQVAQRAKTALMCSRTVSSHM